MFANGFFFSLIGKEHLIKFSKCTLLIKGAPHHLPHPVCVCVCVMYLFNSCNLFPYFFLWRLHPLGARGRAVNLHRGANHAKALSNPRQALTVLFTRVDYSARRLWRTPTFSAPLYRWLTCLHCLLADFKSVKLSLSPAAWRAGRPLMIMMCNLC